MRMRKKTNLIPRMQKCSAFLVPNPAELRGRWLSRGSGAKEVHLELGCGKGRFTCGTAAAAPEALLVAIERVPDAMVIAMERAHAGELKNALFVDGDAAKLEEYFTACEVSRVYVNFCDPWPTLRHAKRRLTHRDFLARYASILPIGGEIHFKTDNLPLFDWSLLQFEAAGYALSEVTHDLHEMGETGIMTDYEEKFHNLGVKINRCVATKIPQTEREAPKKSKKNDDSEHEEKVGDAAE